MLKTYKSKQKFKTNIMKHLLIITTIIIHFFSYGQNTQLSLKIDGNYNGENIHINNPISEEEVGYSITTIYVNDRLITDQINLPIIEIDFSKLSIQIGEQVKININHKINTLPKILNPEVISRNCYTNETSRFYIQL